MRRGEIHHPIHAAIDDIWKAGHTPRIQVDARREDVVVPEFVKTKWGARLVLDLDAAWPLNFEATETGIEVDLAFQGSVTRCTLPWPSIYVVLDRATGRGIVIESHLPREDAEGAPEPSKKPVLRPVGGDAPRALEVVRPSEPPRASDPPPAEVAEKTEETPAPPTDSSDEEAKRRRARFKVIDGGR